MEKTLRTPLIHWALPSQTQLGGMKHTNTPTYPSKLPHFADSLACTIAFFLSKHLKNFPHHGFFHFLISLIQIIETWQLSHHWSTMYLIKFSTVSYYQWKLVFFLFDLLAVFEIAGHFIYNKLFVFLLLFFLITSQFSVRAAHSVHSINGSKDSLLGFSLMFFTFNIEYLLVHSHQME